MAARSNQKVSARTEPRVHWQFVNISSPVQSRDAGFKRLVRGNAMRSHRRNEKRNRVGSSSRIKAVFRDGRNRSPMIERAQLSKEVLQVSGRAADSDDILIRDDIVLRADNDWWQRELDPLWELLEAALPLKRAHETVSRITNATQMSPTTSHIDYAIGKSKRSWSNQSSGHSSPVSNPQTYLDAGIVDPFGTSPTGNHPQRQRLIHHCKHLAFLNM